MEKINEFFLHTNSIGAMRRTSCWRSGHCLYGKFRIVSRRYFSSNIRKPFGSVPWANL